MFSRLATRSGAQKGVISLIPRQVATSQVVCSAAAGDKPPRPVRLMTNPPVRMGFIPDTWFQFFYPKTGVTGPYMFGASVSTWLISKEIYVLDHEFFIGLSIIYMVYFATTRFGPMIANYLDTEIDKLANSWDDGRNQQVNSLKQMIKNEEKSQWRTEGQITLLDAKRENVKLQLEAAYRERLMKAYVEVKKRLDYQVEKQNIERRIAQKNLVDWVVRSVLKSITPEQEKNTLSKCVADLNALAAKA